MSFMSTGSAGESMIDRKSLGFVLGRLDFKLFLCIEITAAIDWYEETAHARYFCVQYVFKVCKQQATLPSTCAHVYSIYNPWGS